MLEIKQGDATKSTYPIGRLLARGGWVMIPLS